MHSDKEDDFFHLSGLNFLQKKSKNSKIYGTVRRDKIELISLSLVWFGSVKAQTE